MEPDSFNSIDKNVMSHKYMLIMEAGAMAYDINGLQS